MKLIAGALLVVAGSILCGAGVIALASPRLEGFGVVVVFAAAVVGLVGWVAVMRNGLFSRDGDLPRAYPTDPARPVETAVFDKKDRPG
jgi:hypothetical protein